MRTQSELALRYNDVSVLENHHCSSAWSVLCEENCNILQNMDPEDVRDLRRKFCQMILATDMSQHSTILGRFQSKLKSEEGVDFENTEDKILVLQMCIKLADVSNISRDVRIYLPWVKRLQTEMFNQVSYIVMINQFHRVIKKGV